jgi:hypothetical protein
MMNWNSDRLARLSGLISRDDYRNNALNEGVNGRLAETEDENNPKFDEADEVDEAEDCKEVDEDDTVAEAKLRQIIRREVSQVIDEVLATREAKQLRHAKKTHSVSAVMGFSGPGFKPQNRSNRAASNGPGGKKGFGGPGFM